MGGRQSRVETSDKQTELHQKEDEQAAETSVSIHMTPALAANIRDAERGGVKSSSTLETSATPTQTMDSELLRKKLQEAYQKGLEDARKSFEAEKKNNSNVLDPATRAQQAKEAEARENARVQKLVTEISQKTYRAPIGEVQCSSEREACLQCYRENSSDVLKCKEVADAFIRCAQETTEKFVKK